MSRCVPRWFLYLGLAGALLVGIEPASAQGANQAQIRAAESSVPGSLAAGTTAAVRLRLYNSGTTTWRAGSGHRLGAWYSASSNQVVWSGFACGGYLNNVTDARVFLCHDVPPGATHDFNFNVTLPAGASGSLRLAVRMVQDGVEWFGEAYAWSISVSSGAKLPDVVVTTVSISPASPSPGQPVTFSAVVRNVGLGATPSGVAVGVAYFIDGAYKTWGSVGGPLAAGASVTIGTQGGAWTATSGNHTLKALADDVNRFAESNENNNSRSLTFSVGSPAPTGSLFGINLDPANPAGNPTAQPLKDIGVRWVRIEWKASPGYAFYDPILAAHRAAGLRVLLLVDYATVGPKPAWNAGDAAWRSYLSSFVAGVRELAAHYADRVDAWQIWNEPDLFAPVAGYDPGVPATHFGAMLRDAVSAIRPFSTRPIVTGGLASGDASYLRKARDAAGGLTVDAIGVHPYGQRAPDNWPYPSWGFGNMSDLFNRYLQFGLPLWVSEIGTQDAPLQPDYLENVYDLARDRYSGRVQVVFWFCWSDGMVRPFGLVDANGNPKPAYYRYKAIAPPD